VRAGAHDADVNRQRAKETTMSSRSTQDLQDLLGDAGACDDSECPCKESAAEAREELAERGIAA
jgi:hypothetical protein